jgi:hypothetical protein
MHKAAGLHPLAPQTCLQGAAPLDMKRRHPTKQPEAVAVAVVVPCR